MKKHQYSDNCACSSCNHIFNQALRKALEKERYGLPKKKEKKK